MITHLQSTAYGWLMLAGILVSLGLWVRLARRDARLVLVYVAALAGAFLGAKAVYLGAEGWMHWHEENRWLVMATGKSITGALLGGYVGVEVAKRLLNYRNATGDWFAIIVPIGVMLGRAGCILQGCCLGLVCETAWYSTADAVGVPRWPAAQTEFLFNALALGAALVLRWQQVLPGQHFHLYLIAYGFFRVVHEYWRETPKIVGDFTGYQVAALMLVMLGIVRFLQRHHQERRDD
jgi:phosphatidylglycerol:prolipoprotein diacylglycerol transferase